MRFYSPALWYPGAKLHVHYDWDNDRSTFVGSKVDEWRSYRGAHEVFDEPLVDGVLVSRSMLTGGVSLVKRDGKFALTKHGDVFDDVRQYVGVSGTSLPSFADPGTWSYVHKFDLPDYLYDTDGMIDYYHDLNFDLAGSVDWPIIDKLRIVGDDGKVRFEDMSTKMKEKRRRLTLDLAKDFIEKCNKRTGLRFLPFGTIQGYSVESYRDSIREILKYGYKYIAIGGLPAYSEKQVLELLPIVWKEIRKSGVRPGIHIYGRFPSPPAVYSFLRYGATSLDNNYALIEATRSACTYFDPEFITGGSSPLGRCIGLRIPPETGPLLRRLKKTNSEMYSEVSSLCRRAFALFVRFNQTESAYDRKKFMSIYRKLLYSLNDTNIHKKSAARIAKSCEVAENALEYMPWKACGCTSCRELNAHVIMTRGQRNRWIIGHNTYVQYSRLVTEIQKCRDDRSMRKRIPWYDEEYEEFDKWMNRKNIKRRRVR